MPLTESPVEPSSRLKVQPSCSMSGETIDMEMTFSRALSLRKMTVRCAQGQESET